MPGPMPKDPALRQRVNKATTRSTLSAETTHKRAPRLPKRGESELPWHAMTRAWWRDCWHSPMESEYLDADMHALYRLAALVDQFWYEPKATLAAEIRLQQQAFGLTPLDRRRLEWSIGQVEATTTRRQQRRVRQAIEGELDPREALRQVK